MPSLDTARGSPAGPSPTISSPGERHFLIRRVSLLERLTLAWTLIEPVVAIAAAIGAQSLSLLAFEIDSLIELISAGVLLWRLTVELKHRQTFSERAERTASRIGGGLLVALAPYVVVSAALSFWQGRGQGFAVVGLALTIATIPAMWWLARTKLAIAEHLGSRALGTDAVESITCGYLSGAVVVGLLAQLVSGAWRVDGITSLAIVYFLA